MVEIKLAVTASFTAISAFLGWKGIMAVVWVAVMLLDYITGTAAACKTGEWCSATARQGLWHKAGMIVVVIVAGIADIVMAVICERLPIGLVWPVIVLPLVLAWYIITEIGSILENAVKMGASVPSWLTKLMKVSLTLVDKAGDVLPNVDTDKTKDHKTTE